MRDALRGAGKRDYNYAYSIAETYMRVGDKDEAFLWLQRAADVRHPAVAALKSNPRWTSCAKTPASPNCCGA